MLLTENKELEDAYNNMSNKDELTYVVKYDKLVGTGSVSYTHLDVYKRQKPHSNIFTLTLIALILINIQYIIRMLLNLFIYSFAIDTHL